MPDTEWTSDEMMTIAASRMLRNGAICFVGIGLPSAAALRALLLITEARHEASRQPMGAQS